MYQSVTIRADDVNITTAYLSPKATPEEELELLQHMEGQNNRKAIIIGDMNARQSDWDDEIVREEYSWKIVQKRMDGT